MQVCTPLTWVKRLLQRAFAPLNDSDFIGVLIEDTHTLSPEGRHQADDGGNPERWTVIVEEKADPCTLWLRTRNSGANGIVGGGIPHCYQWGVAYMAK